jgi:hypothetical protein
MPIDRSTVHSSATSLEVPRSVKNGVHEAGIPLELPVVSSGEMQYGRLPSTHADELRGLGDEGRGVLVVLDGKIFSADRLCDKTPA